jgi:hypothetical protein
MYQEIYCRNNTDPGYNPNALITNSKLEGLLNKIRMILFTKPGEVLGEPLLGINLEYRVFETYINGDELEREIYAQFAGFIPEFQSFAIEVKITFERGEIRDTCYLDIFIDGTKYLGVIAN